MIPSPLATFIEAKKSLHEIQDHCKKDNSVLVGVFNCGGHGDKMVNIAACRAIYRQIASRLPDKAIHLTSICTKSNTPIDREAYMGTEKWIQSKLLIMSQAWQHMFLEFQDEFDLLFTAQYTVNAFTTNWPLFWPMVLENLQSMKLFSPFWSAFPSGNNALANQYRISQWDLMSLTAGFPIRPGDMYAETEPAPRLVKKVIGDLGNKPFVTIHHGQGGIGTTKCLTQEAIMAIVAQCIKMGYLAIQIGAAKDPEIPGAINLRASSMQGSAYMMKRSALHIDNEGFLPYVGRAINKRCLTFFGPTPVWFFNFGPEEEFPGHYFHTSGRCEPCWWCNASWMQQCPKGFRSCVNLASGREAASAVERALLDNDMPKGSGYVGDGRAEQFIAAPIRRSFVPPWLVSKLTGVRAPIDVNASVAEQEE